MLGTSRLNRIREIDLLNRRAVVEAGVVNLAVSRAVAAHKLIYAPDPSSQSACTIGGNVAENSGGVHCLKYGLTTNNVLGVEFVTPVGEVVRIGGKHLDSGHYDLLGLTVGSEGLIGIVTEVTVRILQRPQSARALLIGFGDIEAAGACVAAIIGRGIIPAGMEMMDRPAIHAAEAFVHAGYPLDVEALVIVELDGPLVEVDYLLERVRSIAAANGASGIRASANEAERLAFWAGR
jgi:glycolate oxidase